MRRRHRPLRQKPTLQLLRRGVSALSNVSTGAFRCAAPYSSRCICFANLYIPKLVSVSHNSSLLTLHTNHELPTTNYQLQTPTFQNASAFPITVICYLLTVIYYLIVITKNRPRWRPVFCSQYSQKIEICGLFAGLSHIRISYKSDSEMPIPPRELGASPTCRNFEHPFDGSTGLRL